MDDSHLLAVPEVSILLGMSERFVLDELRRKNLRGSRIGGTWRVRRSDLNTYLDAHANVSRVRKSA